jgi:N-acetylmuramoyl-L-alanine amidase
MTRAAWLCALGLALTTATAGANTAPPKPEADSRAEPPLAAESRPRVAQNIPRPGDARAPRRVEIAKTPAKGTTDAPVVDETKSIPAAPGATRVEPPRPAAAPDLAIASQYELTEAGGKTVFLLSLSRPVAIEAFGLADPYRIIVELPEMAFSLPKEAGREPVGPVVSWRYGLFMAGRSRLVFDTSGPVAIAAARTEIDPARGTTRLRLELTPTTREAFAATTALKPRAPVLQEGAGILPKGDREAPRPPRAKPVVVLDPGHGGIDAGTRSPATGTLEKGVVLDIAKLLKQKLDETGRYDVRLTRADDTFVPLADRVRIARAAHADLFLSIHADAEYDHGVRGATVYTLDDRASDQQAAALAAKENESDALAGVLPEQTPDEVADILIDLTVRETKRFSHALARNLIEDLRQNGKLVKGNPLRSANFRVLKAHDIPSALVELGFLSNKEDEALMKSIEWRNKTTAALVDSIDKFFRSKIADGAR